MILETYDQRNSLEYALAYNFISHLSVSHHHNLGIYSKF